MFLQRQLYNEPLTLVKSLEVGSQNYTSAKDLLTRAFASSLTQQYENVKQLSNIKFLSDTPYEFVSKIRVLLEAFRSLDITLFDITVFFSDLLCQSRLNLSISPIIINNR